jgi:hypothetical protein
VPRGLIQGTMETVPTPSTAQVASPKAGREAWCEWLCDRAQPGPGREPRWVWVALVPADPPMTPRPTWLLNELYTHQELLVRGAASLRSAAPAFQVLTGQGRDLGLISGTAAALFDFALSEGLEARMRVAMSSSSTTPEDELYVFIDVRAYLLPGEEQDQPIPFAERIVGA